MELSLALTHHNRYEMLREAVAQVEEDPRVREIVVSDDASTDGSWERLLEDYRAGVLPKWRLFRNERNVDCYRNKAQVVSYAAGPWVVLFDSDNVMTPAYLDALEAAEPWQPGTAYLPTYAEPEFDYRAFEGLTVDRTNVHEHVDRPSFLTALNTANYLVERDEYLRVHKPDADPGTADSIYMNFRWLVGGNRLYFVPGLRYRHRVHDGSHFVANHTRERELFKRRIEDSLARLR